MRQSLQMFAVRGRVDLTHQFVQETLQLCFILSSRQFQTFSRALAEFSESPLPGVRTGSRQ
jgi:hypothetical protein